MKERTLCLPRFLVRRDGMVLISTLLILASVSMIALGMSSDTSSDVRIAGNRKQFEQTFHLADGAADLGVQVLLDHLDDTVEPEDDYPGTESIPLIDGQLYMSGFHRDANLLADIQGYPENDNADDPDPDEPLRADEARENGHPADLSFDLTAPSGSNFSNSSMTVDIDRLSANLLVGSSIEFAAGYEGVGRGAGAGSVAVYYAVHTRSGAQTASSITSEVSTVYRKVSQVIGGGE